MPSPSGGKVWGCFAVSRGEGRTLRISANSTLCEIGSSQNTHGFILQNEGGAISRAGAYLCRSVRPARISGITRRCPSSLRNKRRGRIHWDLEEFPGCRFISDRMKMVLEPLDPGAFCFCEMQGAAAGRIGCCGAVGFVMSSVCSMLSTRKKSDIDIRTATDGSKYYSLSRNFNLAFKEDVVGQNDPPFFA